MRDGTEWRQVERLPEASRAAMRQAPVNDDALLALFAAGAGFVGSLGPRQRRADATEQ